jgi:hypothetical protein
MGFTAMFLNSIQCSSEAFSDVRELFFDAVRESGGRSGVGMAPKETRRGMVLVTGRSDVFPAECVIVDEVMVL